MEGAEHEIEPGELLGRHVGRAVFEDVHLDRPEHAERFSRFGVGRVQGIDPSALVCEPLAVLTVRDREALRVIGGRDKGPPLEPGGLRYLRERQPAVAVGAVHLEIAVRGRLPRRIHAQDAEDLRVGEVPDPRLIGFGRGRRFVDPPVQLGPDPRTDPGELGERPALPCERRGLLGPEHRGPRGSR